MMVDTRVQLCYTTSMLRILECIFRDRTAQSAGLQGFATSRDWRIYGASVATFRSASLIYVWYTAQSIKQVMRPVKCVPHTEAPITLSPVYDI